jgi:acyl carrier protein
MRDKVLDILSHVRPECDFSDSSDFIADGMLDSFDILSLVAELDETFAIRIDGTDIVPENFVNIETIESLLQKHGVS